MVELKLYLDNVMTTEAEVQRIAAELDALFRQDTDEARSQALAKKEELDQAMAKHEQAVALYESMQKSNRPNDVAKNFVPVSTIQPEEGVQPTVIKRSEYDQMSPMDRANFYKSGGMVED